MVCLWCVWIIKGDLGNCISKHLPLSGNDGIVPSVSGWDCLGLFVQAPWVLQF